MSHFTVGVITKDYPIYNKIDALLAPYDENKEVEHFISKEELIAEERQNFEDYKNGTYAKYLADPEAYKANCTNPKHIFYLEQEFPKKFEWTDEDFYKEALQYVADEDVMPDGSVRSMYNPNSKWDWWEIGGRCSGLLMTKDGQQANTLPIKEIANLYDKEKEADAKKFWEIFVEGSTDYSEGEIKEVMSRAFYKKEYLLKIYKTKENYIKCCCSLATYALLIEGKEWEAKGEMCYFGISDEENGAEIKWLERMTEVLTNPDYQDYFLTVVDCHI